MTCRHLLAKPFKVPECIGESSSVEYLYACRLKVQDPSKREAISAGLAKNGVESSPEGDDCPVQQAQNWKACQFYETRRRS